MKKLKNKNDGKPTSKRVKTENELKTCSRGFGVAAMASGAVVTLPICQPQAGRVRVRIEYRGTATITQDAAETALRLRRLLPLQKPGDVYTDKSKEFIKPCQHLQRTRYEYFSSFRNPRDPRKGWSTSRRRYMDRDGSKWPSRNMMGPCDGTLLLLVERSRHTVR